MDIDSPVTPTTNGVNGTAQDAQIPTPPPHSSSPTSPQADEFKVQGNKYFKDKEYQRAIQEYNKG